MHYIVSRIKKINLVLKEKWLTFFTVLLIILLSIITAPEMFAQFQPVDRIEIYSDSANYLKGEPGAWKITKSAEWINKNEALITFDVDTISKMDKSNKDILFVFDTSSSMEFNELESIKSGSIKLLDSLFSNKNNRAGIVAFNTDSVILSEFTDDKNKLTNEIKNLSSEGQTNYYQALLNVNTVLEGYRLEKDRDLIVLFLSDGHPNLETPNEIAYFKFLQSNYPFMITNGIQYGMGDSILNYIKELSDNQYIADVDNITDILFSASTLSLNYDSFTVSDYVDTNNFSIKDEDAIQVDKGNFVFDKDQQQVTWNILGLTSGTKAKMTMKVIFKNEFDNDSLLLPTNRKEEVHTKIQNLEDKVESTKTPILSNKYEVIYDENAPSNCKVSNIPAKKRWSVFETVEISGDVPVCEGYQFDSWEIVNKDVEKINGDYFIMPSSNVEIRATWSKLDLTKSMDGKVEEKLTLYDQVQLDANDDSKYVRKYTGDASTFKGNKNVYYYYGQARNNNVIFAGYCWNIVRTTDTGGVKLLYSGVPSSDGICSNTSTDAVLPADQTLANNVRVRYSYENTSPSDIGYMYNIRHGIKRYTLASSTMAMTSVGAVTFSENVIDNGDTTYTLSNPIVVSEADWVNNYANYRNYYTCGNSSLTCSNMLLVESTSDSAFNYREKIIYGNSFKYENGKYKLVDTENIWDVSNNKDPLKKHHYTCFNDSGVCDAARFVVYSQSSAIDFVELDSGKSIIDILEESLYSDDVNKYDSEVKKTVDYWYANNMIDYTDYLEDTVWCNDRRVLFDGSGWDPDNGNVSTPLYFAPAVTNDLTCETYTDQFTVGSNSGNGSLTYPVGLLTAAEIKMAYSGSSSLNPGFNFWTMSAYDMESGVASYRVSSNGNVGIMVSDGIQGVRPAISLKSGISYSDGNGSSLTPYIIETNN